MFILIVGVEASYANSYFWVLLPDAHIYLPANPSGGRAFTILGITPFRIFYICNTPIWVAESTGVKVLNLLCCSAFSSYGEYSLSDTVPEVIGYFTHHQVGILLSHLRLSSSLFNDQDVLEAKILISIPLSRYCYLYWV